MKLVTVFTSISINEVMVVKSILEGSGIKTAVLGDTVASLAPHYLFGQGGPRLVVNEKDAQQAFELVKEYDSNNSNPPPE